MIASQDRSGWFGASDTAKIMGNWNTKTFRMFWMEKLGLHTHTIRTPEMLAGTHYEHRILEALGITEWDRQIKIEELLLRVNLDGESTQIHEVKTHKKPVFAVTKPYWMQAQVEMFAAQKPLEIVSYRMMEEDYTNFFNPIDLSRVGRWPIAYEPAFIEAYKPRLAYLADCLRKGVWPIDGNQFQRRAVRTPRRRIVAVPER